MNSKPLLKALAILFALLFLVIGVIFFISLPNPSTAFSTSYYGSPKPKPAPKDEPRNVVEVPGFIQSFDISPDGSMIAIATSQELILYNLKTLDKIHSLPLSEKVHQTSFSPDAKHLAASGSIRRYAGSGPLHVKIWDTASWGIQYEYTSASDSGDGSSFGALDWAPNSRQIAFSIPERGLSIIDIKTGKTIAKLEDFIVPPFELSWSPDGVRLISTGDLGYGLRRWRVDTDEWVRLFDTRPQPAMQVKWSPNGQQIASGHFGGTVCVWNAANNQCEGYIKAHFLSVDALDWSPDSRQIATASGAVRIWDSHTGELKSSFGFYDGIVYKDLRWFNPQTIATLEISYTQYMPSTIRFWDVSTGEVKLAFRGWDNIQGFNSNGGMALELNNVKISPERTVIQVSLHSDTPYTSIAGEWHLTMTDSKGRIYPLTDITPETMDEGEMRMVQTVPLQAGEHITLDLSSFPQNGKIPLMMDLSESPVSFTFDPGALQIGESLELNEELEVNGYHLHLSGARKISANELLFEFASDRYLNGAQLNSRLSSGSSSGVSEDGKLTTSLSFSEMPNDPIQIEITRLYYNAFSPWLLEFQVAESMFTDLPPATPASTPAAQTAPTFTSQEPLFLEVQSLSKKFNESMVQGPGWVHVVSESVTETRQQGQTYPPPYYQEEQWFEIDPDGWVTRSLTTHWDVEKNILQQNISVGTQNMNLTTGEAQEFPIYRLSLDWILMDLDYALNHGQTVLHEETVCEDNSPCMQITMSDGNIVRRAWINVETGQQVKMQTSQQMPAGTENILFTQTFLSVQQAKVPPQNVLDIFSKVLLPTP